MTSKYMRIFIAKYLNLSTGENRGKTVPDPMIRFKKADTEGKYKHLSKEEYEEMRQSVEEESELFYGEVEAYPGEILMRAFYAIDLPYKTCLLIAGIIAKATEHQKMQFAKINDGDFSAFMDLPDNADTEELPFFTDDLTHEYDKRLLNMSPTRIYEHLSKDVFGHDEAKRALSMFIFNHIHGRPTNLLLSGPTGSGKSALIDSLSKIPGLQVKILDGSSLVSTGYKGTHLQSAFSPEDNGKNLVILDEFDKCAMPHNDSRTNYRDLLLTGLLPYLGHTKVHVENSEKFGNQTIDCTQTSFLLVGSFAHILQEINDVTKRGIGFGAKTEHIHTHDNTELTADLLIKHGVHRELVGRINDIVSLKPLTADDFKRILDSPDVSPITKLAKQYGVEVYVSETYKTLLAEEAYLSGLGCRAVYSALKRRLDLLLFDDCKQKKFYLDVPEDTAIALPADPAKPDIARMPQPALAFAYAEEEHS